MPTLQRCEVWSDYQCAGGTRQAVLPVDHATRLVTTTRLTRDDEGQLEMSKDAASYASISDGVVLRLLSTDASFDEWRVREIEDTSKSSRLVRLLLQSPLFDLHTGAALITHTTDTVVTPRVEYKALAPAAVLASILAFAPAWWSAGTITPTIPVNLTADGWMPLRAIRGLVDAIQAQGVSCELDIRRNGVTGYYIDLIAAIGASASTVDVRTAKNLLSTTRSRDRTKYATEVVPLGAGSPKATLATAWWECTAKSGTTLTMQQPVTGGPMLAFDDQLNTSRYLVDDAGARQQITDGTAGATQQIVVASAANVTVGRWYRVVADSSGNEMVGLRKAAGTVGPIATYTASDLTAATNLIGNPAMRVWSGALPDGWTQAANGTYTKTTTVGLWVYGGQSCRVQNSATSAASLTSPLVGVYIPSAWVGRVLTASCWVRITADAGSGALTMQVLGRSAGTTPISSATNVTNAGRALNTWHRIDVNTTLTASDVGVNQYNMKFAFGAAEALGDVYIDSAQLTIATPATTYDFLEGSDAARLWSVANRYLTLYSTTPAAYSVQFADLGQWDAVSFPYDTVVLGATANVRDTDLGVTTSARIVELTRDWRNPLASRITVANRPQDLLTTLTGIGA